MKRKVIVQIDTENGMKEFDGIDVKFSVKKLMSSVMNEAQIDICNLSRSDIEYLTTYTSEFLAIDKHKRVRILAGYEESGVSLIFDGDIARAIPTNPPDVWLKCKALSGYYDNKTPISISMTGTLDIKNVCERCASALGMPLRYMATQSNMITDFNFNGDLTKVISELNDIGGIAVWEEDGTLFVVNDNYARDDLIARELSEDSGMIGVPKVDPSGIEVNVLLDNSLQVGQMVVLKSKVIPSANGNYFIYELKHEGQLRGNTFQTTIKARREDNELA